MHVHQPPATMWIKLTEHIRASLYILYNSCVSSCRSTKCMVMNDEHKCEAREREEEEEEWWETQWMRWDIMMRSYYYRVSHHDDSQSAGSLLRQPMRAKGSTSHLWWGVRVQGGETQWQKTSSGDDQLTKQPRKSTNELRGLEQCHEQSRQRYGCKSRNRWEQWRSWMQCAKPLGRASSVGESVTGELRVWERDRARGEKTNATYNR